MIAPFSFFRFVSRARKLCLGAAWVFLLGSTQRLAAQESPAPQPGSRMRVRPADTAPAKWLVGDVRQQSGDSVVLRVEGQEQPLRLAWADVSAAEVSGGHRSHALTGALVGGGVGLGLAALLSTDPEMVTDLMPTAAGFAIAFLVPTGLGALIGTAVRTERWRPYNLPRGSLRSGGSNRWLVTINPRR